MKQPSDTSTNGHSSPEWFSRFARAASLICGKPVVFLAAVAIVILWAATGPMFQYSDTWQLVINTGTTIITFLMVFLIQNTQNRDSAAIQLKLSELIVAVKGAQNRLANIEDASEEELEELREELKKRAAKGDASPKLKVVESKNKKP
jgi:low affinity Fe/Cu permease